MAEVFSTELLTAYPYQALHPQDDFSGQGLISRYPITADEFWQINLGHERVELDRNGTALTLYNTHPVHPLRDLRFDGESRAEEITDMLRGAAQEQGALLSY